jgi:hypothetical protein
MGRLWCWLVALRLLSNGLRRDGDRPDITDSSPLVPFGSFQSENAVDWVVRHGSNVVDRPTPASASPRSRSLHRAFQSTLRLTSIRQTKRNLREHLTSSSHSGVKSLCLLVLPYHTDRRSPLSERFPANAGRSYPPYAEFSWSHKLADEWAVVGMFASHSARNPTLESTFSLEREFGPAADVFVKYVGD